MTLEERLQKRLQEWRKMAQTFRAAERECDEREIDARQDEDEKRAKEEQSEAELNKAWAEALERCAGNLAADLAARNSPRSPPATSRPASVA
jgi:hypothetical protein